MIKILFFIDTLTGGGAEKVLCNLVNHMDQSRFDITVCTIMYQNPEGLLAEGIHYKYLFASTSKLMNRLRIGWYRLCTQIGMTYRLYLKGDYDIEIAYLECGPTKVLAASSNKKAKKLAWIHCDVKKKGLTQKKSGRYYRKYDQAICVSADAKKSFDQVFRQCVPSIVLHNVIAEQEIISRSREPFTESWDKSLHHFITVGRICHEKGSDRLLLVCEMLKKAGYRFQLHLIGEGPDKMSLLSRAKERALSDCIVFEGYKENPYPMMLHADAVVIPSRTEAWSTVAVEALMLGKAVVTTPCAGMSEIFRDSACGIIAEDNVNSLYEHLSRLMDDSLLKACYEKRAEQRARDFRVAKTIQDTEEYFAGVVS